MGIDWTATHESLPFHTNNLFDMAMISGLLIMILIIIAYEINNIGSRKKHYSKVELNGKDSIK